MERKARLIRGLRRETAERSNFVLVRFLSDERELLIAFLVVPSKREVLIVTTPNRNGPFRVARRDAGLYLPLLSHFWIAFVCFFKSFFSFCFLGWRVCCALVPGALAFDMA